MPAFTPEDREDAWRRPVNFSWPSETPPSSRGSTVTTIWAGRCRWSRVIGGSPQSKHQCAKEPSSPPLASESGSPCHDFPQLLVIGPNCPSGFG